LGKAQVKQHELIRRGSGKFLPLDIYASHPVAIPLEQTYEVMTHKSSGSTDYSRLHIGSRSSLGRRRSRLEALPGFGRLLSRRRSANVALQLP
jgi:hypothetical protein